jgi:hypothetical protein
MDEQQFRQLCKTCDRVLMEHVSTIERIAISWLHVIREHPQFLTQYEDLFRNASKFDKHRWELQRDLYNWVGRCWLLAKALFSGGRKWFASKDPQAQIDFLFVSHLINKSQVGQASDFYYGNLPNELAEGGYTTAIALINHTKHRSDELVGEWGNSNVSRLILSKSLGFLKEFALHRRLKVESLSLSEYAKDMQASLFQKVLKRASQEALSGTVQTTMRISEQVNSLVATLNPKIVVVTYEGHAWERLAFAAARRALPTVKCVAYQHAALFRMQHAIRRKLMNEYNPDHILTAGPDSKVQFECAPELKGTPISVLGSNRSFKGAVNLVRFEYGKKQVENSEKLACLVLPEGVLSECNILFEFSLECARAAPKNLFIWRLHPLVSFVSLFAQNSKFRNLPVNIVLSQSTLEDDIARSRWVLYRGTTAVVQSVVAGLRPIYLQLPGELPIDLLYELEGWKISITNISELRGIIDIDAEIPEFSPESDIEYARRYCESLFTPFNVDAITALLPR